jgi:carboxylesterase
MNTPFTAPEHQPFTLHGGRGAMLLVHGFPGTPAELRPLADALHTAGWTVEGLLLPGFGNEIATLGKRHYTDWIKAVEARLNHLRQTHTTVVLVGFSMGGAVSLNVAHHTPPDALVLINPFTRLGGSLFALLPIIKRIIPQFEPFKLLKPDFTDPEVRQNMLQFMPGADMDDPQVQAVILSLKLPTNALDQLRLVGRSATRLAPGLKTRTLVIQAAGDKTVNPAYTRELLKRLPAGTPLVEVPGDHNFIRYAPASLAAAVTTILDFVDAQM